MNEKVGFAMMTDGEKYLFDLQGFLVVRAMLTPGEVDALNAAVDANVYSELEYDQAGPTYKGTKLDGEIHHHQFEGMLTWPQPWCQPFRELMAHPKLIPYLNTLLGRGWKLDTPPAMFIAKDGCEGHGLSRSHSWPLYRCPQLYVSEWSDVLRPDDLPASVGGCESR